MCPQNNYKLSTSFFVMAEQPQMEGAPQQGPDFNTRLRDIEERNRLIRERVLLLGNNLISSREDIDNELKEIKKENSEIKRELEKIKKVTNSLLTEFNKFVKRDELSIVERMLKDFEPLKFVREKDVIELIDKKLEARKK